MPPKIRFSKEAIMKTAYNIARTSGIEAVNARSIAKALGSSTQPLFREYQSMDDIKQDVFNKAHEEYKQRIQSDRGLYSSPYKNLGMAFIRFAYEEPELFKMLFFRDRVTDAASFDDDDGVLEYIYEAIMKSLGYTRDEAVRLHRNITVYSYGLATMVATRYIEYNEDEISALTYDVFTALTSQIRPATAEAHD